MQTHKAYADTRLPQDMQISVKENTIFSIFHPDAVDLFNACSDLKKVAHELWDPSYRLNAEDKSINLFQAFAPMLCKRPGLRLEDTVKDMGGQPFIIEEKLDGERMQLHKRGNKYFFCSRYGRPFSLRDTLEIQSSGKEKTTRIFMVVTTVRGVWLRISVTPSTIALKSACYSFITLSSLYLYKDYSRWRDAGMGSSL